MAILCTAIHIYDRDRLMIFFYYPTFKQFILAYLSKDCHIRPRLDRQATRTKLESYYDSFILYHYRPYLADYLVTPMDASVQWVCTENAIQPIGLLQSSLARMTNDRPTAAFIRMPPTCGRSQAKKHKTAYLVDRRSPNDDASQKAGLTVRSLYTSQRRTADIFVMRYVIQCRSIGAATTIIRHRSGRPEDTTIAQIKKKIKPILSTRR